VTVVGLALAYAGVGALVALVALAARRASALDAVLLLGLWPLYGPVLAGGAAGRAAPDGADAPDEPALMAVLRRADAMPRGGALVGGLAAPARAQALARRLRAGRARMRDLAVALAQPALALGAPARGDAPAWQRDAILHLRARRARGAAALAEIDQIVIQLATALEVARLAGPADDAIAELAAELAARIEQLDALAGNEPGGADVASP
jgi:hypothetical protein